MVNQTFLSVFSFCWLFCNILLTSSFNIAFAQISPEREQLVREYLLNETHQGSIIQIERLTKCESLFFRDEKLKAFDHDLEIQIQKVLTDFALIQEKNTQIFMARALELLASEHLQIKKKKWYKRIFKPAKFDFLNPYFESSDNNHRIETYIHLLKTRHPLNHIKGAAKPNHTLKSMLLVAIISSRLLVQSFDKLCAHNQDIDLLKKTAALLFDTYNAIARVKKLIELETNLGSKIDFSETLSKIDLIEESARIIGLAILPEYKNLPDYNNPELK